MDADVLSCIRWPEAIDIDTQTVHAVCKGVQALHGKVETLCQGAQAVDALCQDNAPPGMTPLQWCKAQAKDPAIQQIVTNIQNKTMKHMKIQGDMPSELEALIRLKKQLLLKQGVLYRRVTPSDAKPRFQLILPPSHRNKAIEGCHDQVGHVGQDRVLELLRDHLNWPGMHIDVASYLNSCPRCLRIKTQADQAPLLNIEVNQPLELIHLDYLKIEPRKGNVEYVLIITDHFTRFAQAFPSKTQTALATAKLLWNNFILHYGFPEKNYYRSGQEF